MLEDTRLLEAKQSGYLDGEAFDPMNAKHVADIGRRIPSPNRRNWTQTLSGGRLYFTDPGMSDITIEDIAAGIRAEPRFNGQTIKPYSVGEHSVRCSFLVPEEHALQALLHDASEAYLKDIASTLKQILDDYKLVETPVQTEIYRRFRLPLEHHPTVKEADARLVATEARLLYPRLDPGWETWLTGHEPIEDMTLDEIGWDWSTTESIFLQRFEELWKVHSRNVPKSLYKPTSFWEVERGHIHWFSWLSGEES